MKMKRICLSKYGFAKWPEMSFSDDGNYFEGWRAGESARVSKLVSNGQAYLSCRVDGNLPYEIYAELPHYRKAVWDFNGVSVNSLTDALLQDFYMSCVEYEKEYRAAEASVEYPSLKALTEKCRRIVNKRLLEIAEAKNLLAKYAGEAVLEFSSYEWARIQDYMKNLESRVRDYNPETRPKAMYGKYTSFNFMESKEDIQDNYWFTSFKEIFNKYGLN